MKLPIRILHVIGAMNCGGAETMIMNLYRNIDREKIQFDFLVHTEEKCFFDDEILELGGKIYSVPRFNLINLFRYKKALKKFFGEHSEYTAVHGHIGSSACIYLNIAKKHGVFAIAHSHSTNSTSLTLKNLTYKLFSLKTRRAADFFFGCSYAAGKSRFGQKIADSEKFAVLKNAIDTEAFSFNSNIREEIRKKLDISDKFVVGHTGRFTEEKNHSYLLDVFSEINKTCGNAVLLLVGDGELRTEIENKISTLKLQDKVILAGVRKDVYRLLQAMDCFVFPSHFEGLPVTAVEAQAAGLPCFISENVTDEVCITKLATKLPITIPAAEWAEKIMDVKNNRQRLDMTDEIKSAGYDIATTAKWLCKFYSENKKR